MKGERRDRSGAGNRDGTLSEQALGDVEEEVVACIVREQPSEVKTVDQPGAGGGGGRRRPFPAYGRKEKG